MFTLLLTSVLIKTIKLIHSVWMRGWEQGDRYSIIELNTLESKWISLNRQAGTGLLCLQLKIQWLCRRFGSRFFGSKQMFDVSRTARVIGGQVPVQRHAPKIPKCFWKISPIIMKSPLFQEKEEGRGVTCCCWDYFSLFNYAELLEDKVSELSTWSLTKLITWLDFLSILFLLSFFHSFFLSFFLSPFCFYLIILVRHLLKELDFEPSENLKWILRSEDRSLSLTSVVRFVIRWRNMPETSMELGDVRTASPIIHNCTTEFHKNLKECQRTFPPPVPSTPDSFHLYSLCSSWNLTEYLNPYGASITPVQHEQDS